MRLNKRTLEVIKRKVLAYLLIAVMVAGVVTPLGYASANSNDESMTESLEMSEDAQEDITECEELTESSDEGDADCEENLARDEGARECEEELENFSIRIKEDEIASQEVLQQSSAIDPSYSSVNENSVTDEVKSYLENYDWNTFPENFEWGVVDSDTFNDVILLVLADKLEKGELSEEKVKEIEMSIVLHFSEATIAPLDESDSGSTEGYKIEGNGITEVTIKWQPSDATSTDLDDDLKWKTVNSTDSIPADAHLKFEVTLNVAASNIAGNNYKAYFDSGNQIDGLNASGSLNVDGENRGSITALGDKIFLEFTDKTFVDNKASLGNAISGKVYFRGQMNLSKIEDSKFKFELGNVNLEIKTDSNPISKYGKVEIDKTEPEVKVVGGKYYLEYSIKVKAGKYGSVDVRVEDRLTSSYALKYVGILETEASLSSSSSPNPTEQITNGNSDSAVGKVALKADDSKTMTWTIGAMAPEEERTLTYRIELPEDYIGYPHNEQINNQASVYSGENPHGNDNTSYRPKVTADIRKVQKADTLKEVPEGSGNWEAEYEVSVTAPADNTYPLKNVKIADDLNRTEMQLYKDSVSYDKDSVELYDNENQKIDISGKIAYASDDKSFNITGIGIEPGKKVTLHYKLKLNATAAQLKADEVGFYNRVNASAVPSTGSPIRIGEEKTTDTSIETNRWERKHKGEQISQPLTVTIPSTDDIYNINETSLEKVTGEKPSSFTVEKAAQRYSVVINEKGIWDVTGTNWGDSLGSNNGKNYLLYTGYVQVSVYENIPETSAKSEAGIENYLKTQTPKRNIWVNVNDLASFKFTGADLGLDADTDTRDAYVLTYYAKVSEDVDFGEANVTNSFQMDGTVIGPDDTSHTLSPVKTVVSSKIIEPGMGSPSKYAWYYDKEDQPFNYGLANGSMYWVVEVDGSKIPKGYKVQESCNGLTGNNHFIRKTESFIGFYVAALSDHIHVLYKDINEFFDAAATQDNIKTIESSYYNMSWTSGGNTNGWDAQVNGSTYGKRYDLTLEFTQKYMIPEGYKLYMIVRSEPGTMPAPATIMEYGNKVNTFIPATNEWKNTNVVSQYIAGPNGSLDKSNEGIYVVSDGGSTVEKFDEIQNNFVDYTDSSKSVDAVFQTKYLSVDSPLKIGSDSTGNYQYEDGTYIVWTLSVNKNGKMAGAENCVIKDTLPAGVELVYVRNSYVNNSHLNQYSGANWTGVENEPYKIMGLKMSDFDGWTEHRTMSSLVGSGNPGQWNSIGTYYYTKGNEIKIAIPKVIGNSTTGAGRIDYQVVCKVTDSKAYLEDIELINKADLLDGSGNILESDSDPVVVHSPGLDKQLLATFTDNKLNGSVIPYQLEINKTGADMDAGDVLSVPLIDHMSNSLSIKMNTIRIYVDEVSDDNLVYAGSRFRLNESNGKDLYYTGPDKTTTGTDVTDYPCYMSEVVGNVNQKMQTTIKISSDNYADSSGNTDGSKVIAFHNLPDSHKIIIHYFAVVSITNPSNVSFNNSAYFEGHENVTGGQSNISSMQYAAGGVMTSAGNGIVNVIKYDSADYSNKLKGAKFAIYEALYDDSKQLILDVNGRPQKSDKVLDGSVKVTNEDGVYSYGEIESENKIRFNKVYCIVETEAPDDYEINTTENYFVIIKESGAELDKGDFSYRSDWPSDVTVSNDGTAKFVVEVPNTKKPTTDPDSKPTPKPDPKPSGNDGSEDSSDSSTTPPPAKPADNKAVVQNGKIPQTGQLWWPVWLMGGLGSLFLILGFLWKPKKKK